MKHKIENRKNSQYEGKELVIPAMLSIRNKNSKYLFRKEPPENVKEVARRCDSVLKGWNLIFDRVKNIEVYDDVFFGHYVFKMVKNDNTRQYKNLR